MLDGTSSVFGADPVSRYTGNPVRCAPTQGATCSLSPQRCAAASWAILRGSVTRFRTRLVTEKLFITFHFKTSPKKGTIC